MTKLNIRNKCRDQFETVSMWHLSQPESGRRTKKQTGLKRDWESPPQLFWKTMENHENKTSLRKKPDF